MHEALKLETKNKEVVLSKVEIFEIFGWTIRCLWPRAKQ
jgi:hypothetical protein